MERKVGTISRGIRCPIIREGDELSNIVVESVLQAGESEGFQIEDRDIVCLTESIVARAQGNYVSVDAIAEDVKNKFEKGDITCQFIWLCCWIICWATLNGCRTRWWRWAS